MRCSLSLPQRWLAALLFAASGHVSAACLPDLPSVTYAQTVPVRFVHAPDVLLHSAGSRVIRYRCDASEDALLRPMLPGLAYVRHINGMPAYEISPDSPLVTLSFASFPDDGSEGLETDLDALRDNPWYFPSAVSDMSVTLDFYSRGGPMRPQAQRALGSVAVIGSGTTEFRFEIGYAFQGTTCTLRNANVVLDPVPARLLDAQITAGHKDFTVIMDCGVPGRPVSLEIFDATDRANTSTLLAPAPGSDAEGVAVQILHKGRLLDMGTVWAHTDSTGAQETLDFAARYVRAPGALKAGLIRGEAVLVANYY